MIPVQKNLKRVKRKSRTHHKENIRALEIND